MQIDNNATPVHLILTFGQWMALRAAQRENANGNTFRKMDRVLSVFYSHDEIDRMTIGDALEIIDDLSQLEWPQESKETLEIGDSTYQLVKSPEALTVAQVMQYQNSDTNDEASLLAPFLVEIETNEPIEYETLVKMDFDKVAKLINAFADFYYDVRHKLARLDVDSETLINELSNANLR